MLVSDVILIGFAIVLFVMSLFMLGRDARKILPDGTDEVLVDSEQSNLNSRRVQKTAIGIICLSLSIGIMFQCQRNLI